MAVTTAPEPAQLLIPADQAMNGFNYDFCRELLKKLKELRDADKIFGHGEAEVWKTSAPGCGPTLLALAVINSLANQLRLPAFDDISTIPEKVAELISATEEFLAIFEA